MTPEYRHALGWVLWGLAVVVFAYENLRLLALRRRIASRYQSQRLSGFFNRITSWAATGIPQQAVRSDPELKKYGKLSWMSTAILAGLAYAASELTGWHLFF